MPSWHVTGWIAPYFYLFKCNTWVSVYCRVCQTWNLMHSNFCHKLNIHKILHCSLLFKI
jgi:hypothetical protein